MSVFRVAFLLCAAGVLSSDVLSAHNQSCVPSQEVTAAKIVIIPFKLLVLLKHYFYVVVVVVF